MSSGNPYLTTDAERHRIHQSGFVQQKLKLDASVVVVPHQRAPTSKTFETFKIRSVL